MGRRAEGAKRTHGQEDMTSVTGRRADVCGRGGAALRHPGNQTYRRLVESQQGSHHYLSQDRKLKIQVFDLYDSRTTRAFSKGKGWNVKR
jgi:hypothetical protein